MTDQADNKNHPCVRADVELLRQSAPNSADTFLLKDPATGRVLGLSGEEAFLCRHFDGKTPPEQVALLFHETFGRRIDETALHGFIRQLQDYGLLTGSTPRQEDPTPWERMKPLPLDANRFFSTLENLFAWTFSLPAQIAFYILIFAAVLVLSAHGPSIANETRHLSGTLAFLSSGGAFNGDMLFRLALILVLIPLFRESAKGIACRRAGVRIAEVRIFRLMHFIPRFAVDLSGILSLPERRQRLRLYSAGIRFELFLLSIAVIGWELSQSGGLSKTFFFSLSMASAISLLISLNPFWKSEAGLWLAAWLDIPDFRRRATRYFRAALFCSPSREALPPRERALFFGCGMAFVFFDLTLNVVVFGLLGYLLVNGLEGFGALLFLAALALRFDQEIRRAIVNVPDGLVKLFSGGISRGKWIAGTVLVLLAVVPLPFYRSGEFHVQPMVREEIRTEIAAQIDDILVQEAATVQKGQVIARLSPRQIRRELEITRATLAREESRLKNLESGAKPELISLAEKRVELADTNLKHSMREYERAKELHEMDNIPTQEFEARLDKKNTDEASLQTAQHELELVKSKAKPEEVNAQQAEVDRLTKHIAHLEDDLKRTEIQTRIDGRVTTLYLAGKVGQMVTPGDIIAVVEDSRTAVLRIALPEEFVGRIKPGAVVQAKAWAFSGRTFRGQVTSIVPVVVDRGQEMLQQASVRQEKGLVRSLDQPSQNVIPVLAEVSNEEGLLFSEMTGYAKIRAGWRPLLFSLLDPVIRFVRVRLWSWLP